jgi:hypothetical protein
MRSILVTAERFTGVDAIPMDQLDHAPHRLCGRANRCGGPSQLGSSPQLTPGRVSCWRHLRSNRSAATGREGPSFGENDVSQLNVQRALAHRHLALRQRLQQGVKMVEAFVGVCDADLCSEKTLNCGGQVCQEFPRQ